MWLPVRSPGLPQRSSEDVLNNIPISACQGASVRSLGSLKHYPSPCVCVSSRACVHMCLCSFRRSRSILHILKRWHLRQQRETAMIACQLIKCGKIKPNVYLVANRPHPQGESVLTSLKSQLNEGLQEQESLREVRRSWGFSWGRKGSCG